MVNYLNIVSFITYIVYRSFFLTGETILRKTILFVKIIFVATMIYTYICSLNKIILLMYMFTLLLILSYIDRGLEWIVSVILLSIIPALWFITTTYLLMIISYRNIDVYILLFILIRTIVLTYTVVFSYSIINPVEIYDLLIKIGLNKYSIAILLFYRLVPYGLNNFNESLSISKLKKEKVKNRLGPAVASIIETINYMNEYCYFKINSEPKYLVKYSIDKTYSLILILVSIINLIITII